MFMFQKNFYGIDNYKNSGKIGISTNVFEEITRLICLEIDGVDFSMDKNYLFRKQDITCKFKGDGCYISINLRVKYGYNVEKVCNEVREKVTQSLQYMTEVTPTKIDIFIADVK